MKDTYKIDQSILSKNYKELQKLVHPDKYLLNDEEVLSEAQKCSSLISNAYNVLKDDFERANYMVTQLCLYLVKSEKIQIYRGNQ